MVKIDSQVLASNKSTSRIREYIACCLNQKLTLKLGAKPERYFPNFQHTPMNACACTTGKVKNFLLHLD